MGKKRTDEKMGDIHNEYGGKEGMETREQFQATGVPPKEEMK